MYLGSLVYASQTLPYCKELPRSTLPHAYGSRDWRAACLLYWTILMNTKSSARKPRRSPPQPLQLIAHAVLPTRYGPFTIYGFKGNGPQEEAVALVRGNLNGRKAPLVRVHSQCLTGDVLTSLRCDCRAQLELSLKKIAQAPSGILLYLPQEGRGIGLMNKLRAYRLQDEGFDTMEANRRLGFAEDERIYDVAAHMLTLLGYSKVKLMTNNPDKVRALQKAGIEVVERVPHSFPDNIHNRDYLRVKATKGGHLL
jgi:GTP cyclohydrolase II